MDKLQVDNKIKEIKTLIDEGNYVKASSDLSEYSRKFISELKNSSMNVAGATQLRWTIEELSDLSCQLGVYFKSKDDSESDKYFRIAEASLQAIRDRLFIYDEKVMVRFAKIYHIEEDYDRAREFYIKAYDLTHDYIIQLNIVDCLIEGEEYNEAHKLLNKIFEEIDINDTTTIRLYLSMFAKLSDLYVASGDNDLAIKCYRKAMSFFYKLPAGMDDEIADAGYSILKTLISLLILKEKFSESLKVLRRGEQKFSNSKYQGNIFNFIGEVYLEMDEFHKAMHCFEKAKAYSLDQDKLFNNNIAKTFNRMGLECYDRRDYLKAAEYFSRAFLLDVKIEYQLMMMEGCHD